MRTLVLMVGGPGHGKRWPISNLDEPIRYETTKEVHTYYIEHMATSNPQAKQTEHAVAVHSNLLVHRKIRRDTVMYRANEKALWNYLLDAAMRASEL